MSFPNQQYLQEYAPAVSNSAQERIAVVESNSGALLQSAAAAAFGGAFLGCLATLHLSTGGFIPAIASAVATVLLCGGVLATRTTNLFPGEFFAAIYGGTFAGMTPILGLIPNPTGGSVMSPSALFILLSIVCGLVFCAVAEMDRRSGRRLAGGCGGRSGAIAAAAAFLFVELAVLFGADGALVRVTQADMSEVDAMSTALACAASMIGTFATLIVLRQRSVASAEPVDRIFIAAVVALTGLIALRLSGVNDTYLSDAFYAGCFLGMSTPARLKGWIEPCLGAILLTGILVLVKALLPGVGGGLGLAALITVIVLAMLRRIMNDVLRPNEHQETAAMTSARDRTGTSPGAWGFKHRVVAVAGPVAALLAIACFVGPAQVGSEAPAWDTVVSAQIAEQSAPTLALPALVETRPAAASVDAANADLGAVAALSLEPNVASIQTGQTPSTAADIPVEPGRTDRAESASTANVEAAQSGVSIDKAPEADQELFREFLRWRAAQPDGVSRPALQPVKRTRNHALQMVRLAPAGSPLQPQSGREPRPPRPKAALATQPAVPGARINPRGAPRNPAIRSAPEQTPPR
jgi:hypothetical protein